MPNQWDFYLYNVNSELASIYVDLDLATRSPDAKRPWLIWVWVYMQSPRPDGLSSKEEADTLWKVEDAIQGALNANFDAIFPGRITTQGRREFYFYGSRKPTDESVIAAALKVFQGYLFSWGAKADPEWEQYFDVLFPPEEEFEKIKNRKVLDLLEKQGDQPSIPREVRHWVYFETEQNRSKFAEDIAPLGYAVELLIKDSESEDWGICASRTSPADAESIDAAVIELYRYAQVNEGLYDGWEAQVTSDDDPQKILDQPPVSN